MQKAQRRKCPTVTTFDVFSGGKSALMQIRLDAPNVSKMAHLEVVHTFILYLLQMCKNKNLHRCCSELNVFFVFFYLLQFKFNYMTFLVLWPALAMIKPKKIYGIWSEPPFLNMSSFPCLFSSAPFISEIGFEFAWLLLIYYYLLLAYKYLISKYYSCYQAADVFYYWSAM